MLLMRKGLKFSKTVIHILAFGLNIADSFRKNKTYQSLVKQLMSSIRAGKLDLIAPTCCCQQVPNAQLHPLFLECPLIMTCLWALGWFLLFKLTWSLSINYYSPAKLYLWPERADCGHHFSGSRSFSNKEASIFWLSRWWVLSASEGN